MWEKKGLLYDVGTVNIDQIRSHASIPFAYPIKNDTFRIYFSSRDKYSKSYPYYIDALVREGKIQLIGETKGPLMELGQLGTFDDSGIMPSCFGKMGDKIFMYYIGWNPQTTVSYRLSIGLAVSTDNGSSFSRYSQGPICDRCMEEPYFNTAPFVMLDDNLWKMWYVSCTGWQMIENHPEPSYHIKYAESEDGIHWHRIGEVCLDYDDRAKAFGRPSVIRNGDKLRMYFSYRDIENYRESPFHGYKIGLAESIDGKIWTKEYEKTGISLSSEGWDSQMIGYCHVFRHQNFEYMLYNGNSFGKEGFGYAVKEAELNNGK